MNSKQFHVSPKAKNIIQKILLRQYLSVTPNEKLAELNAKAQQIQELESQVFQLKREIEDKVF